MDEFQRYILSIFVDLQESNPGEFTRYYKAVDLIQTNFRKAKLSITTDQIDEAINMLIDDGYLEGMGTSYRLSAMGKVYWENHSLLEEVNRLTAEVKKARQMATLALIASLISIAAVLLLQVLR
jgi:hypothetical protein